MQTPIGSIFYAFTRHSSSVNVFSTRYSMNIPLSSLGAQQYSGRFVQYMSGQHYSNIASDCDLFGLYDDIFLPL